MLNCYLWTQTFLVMKLNQKMFMMNFLNGKIYQNLVIINEKILSFCDFVNFFVIKKHHLKNQISTNQKLNKENKTTKSEKLA